MNKKPLWLAWLEYLPAALIFPLLRRLPYEWAHRLARPLGTLLYYLLPRYRRVALRNLDIAFADELTDHEARSIAKQSFINFVTTLFEMILLSRMSAKEVYYVTRFAVGYMDYQTIMRDGRGAIVCSIHFANWYWTVVGAAIEGYKVNVVVRSLDNPYLDRMMTQMFARWGIGVIPRDKVFPKAVAALRRGETLALMIDQNTIRQGCFVPFFGTPAATMRGLTVLKRGTNANVFCAHDVREGTHHRAIIEPMMDLSDDEETCLRQIHEYFEPVIREHKGQYFWLHSRWKTRPEGEPSLYQRQTQT